MTGPFSAGGREDVGSRLESIRPRKPRLCACLCGVEADIQNAAADVPHWISLELEMHVYEEEPPPGHLLPDAAHTSLLCASLSSQICRLVRHRNTLPPSRLVWRRILGRVRGNNVYYFPRTPPRSRGHAILSPRRRGHAARKVGTAAA